MEATKVLVFILISLSSLSCIMSWQFLHHIPSTFTGNFNQLWLIFALSLCTQAENMIVHQEEIFSRPKKTWFITDKEKKLVAKAAKVSTCCCIC